jgi:SAM-dependent methyltransferase
MTGDFVKQPTLVIPSKDKEINIFDIREKNIDKKAVTEFGEEWLKFNDFTDKRIKEAAEEYFDIIDEKIVNKNTYAIDIGRGIGRWTKYLSSKARFIEAVDPSNAIFAAAELLGGINNVRLTKASIETLPFADETFDFAMSVGVLHHIPDTQKAMIDCAKKIKKGGYFYVYLYYNLDERGFLFKTIFRLSDFIRSFVSKFPGKIKHFVCDILAILIYMPVIFLVRFFVFIGSKNFENRMPLKAFANKSFFIIRNDALDRFGTRLEKRFSKKEIIKMMQTSGLSNILIRDGIPYYHTIGQKI